MNSGPHPDCPEEKVLQEIAAEARPADAYAETVLHHAAQCPHCGPILSRYLQEFSDEPVAELQALNKNEEPAWQNSLARELANKSRPKEAGLVSQGQSGKVGRFPVWARVTAMAAPIAAVIVLAIFLGPGLYAKLDFKKTDRLIAADYAKNRHTLMRPDNVPYGAYKPEIHELGSDANSLGLNRPDLAKANGILADHQNTNDPKWTRQEGRIALLKGADGLKQAEDAFDRAKAEGMNDPGLEIDLAVTYFERDSRSDNPNLAQTIDLLNHVLKNPKLTAEQRNTALFDLAVAYEKSNMLDMAADTWAEYLKADTNTSGGWYKEAQQHLSDLKKKLPPPRAADFRQPGYLLRHLDDPEVQNDIEQFQDFALAHWLPDAFRNPGSDSARAIHAIADLMEKQHGDTWWRDFLRSTTAQDLPAIEAASAAFLSSDNDLHQKALQEAEKAKRLFRAGGNFQGQAIADYAAVYALQRLVMGSDCLNRSNGLFIRLRSTKYFWLRGQTALETSMCANLTSDFKRSDVELAKGTQIAHEHNFPELKLRAVGAEVGFFRSRFRSKDSWHTAITGLSGYWDGSCSWERLYQFYAVMHQAATDLNLPDASEAILRNSIGILRRNAPDDKVLLAHLDLRLARILYELGDQPAGDVEVAHAAELLKDLPDWEVSSKTYYAVSVLELATLHVEQGKAEIAVRELEPLADVLRGQDDFITLNYYGAYGSAQLESDRVEEAAKAFAHGIDLADRALLGLQSDVARTAWVRSTDQLYRGVAQLFIKQHRDFDALQLWEWAKNRSLNGPPQRLSAARLLAADWKAPQVTLQFRPGVQRLIYASFPSELQIWFYDGHKLESTSLPLRRSDLAHLARQFLKACSKPESPLPSTTDAIARQLSPVLLKLLTVPTALQPLAIEPDDVLASVPFEALKTADGSYLDEHFIISYSPGLIAEESLRTARFSADSGHLLFTNASAPNGQERLPGIDLVLEAVRKLSPQADIFPAFQASPDRATAEIQHSRAMLFFGHARQNGTGSALELHPGVILSAQDLRPDSVSGLNFVFLAACSTDASEGGFLDSSSLVRTFLNGRVPYVVASHWDVDSNTTAAMVVAFLRNWPSDDPAVALRKARAQIRQRQNNPYFWSAFSLNGRGAASR